MEKKRKELRIATLCLKKYTKKFSIFEMELNQKNERISVLEKFEEIQEESGEDKKTEEPLLFSKSFNVDIEANFSFQREKSSVADLQTFQLKNHGSILPKLLKIKSTLADFKLEKNSLETQVNRIKNQLESAKKWAARHRKKEHQMINLSFQKNSFSEPEAKKPKKVFTPSSLSIEKTLYNCSFSFTKKSKQAPEFEIDTSPKSYSHIQPAKEQSIQSEEKVTWGLELGTPSNYSFANTEGREALKKKLKGFTQRVVDFELYAFRSNKSMILKLTNMQKQVGKLRPLLDLLNESRLKKDNEQELIDYKLQMNDIIFRNNELEQKNAELNDDIKYLDERLMEQEKRFDQIKDKKKKELRKENEELNKRVQALEKQLGEKKSLGEGDKGGNKEEEPGESEGQKKVLKGEVPDFDKRIWEVLQTVTKIPTSRELLPGNFLKIESILVKHRESHEFLLEIKAQYEQNWTNPLKNTPANKKFEKMKAFIKEDIGYRYLG